MASKKKVSLNDYDLTTTLGTGMLFTDAAFTSVGGDKLTMNQYRVIWQSEAGEEQEIRGVLRHENIEEVRHYKTETGGSCDI